MISLLAAIPFGAAAYVTWLANRGLAKDTPPAIATDDTAEQLARDALARGEAARIAEEARTRAEAERDRLAQEAAAAAAARTQAQADRDRTAAQAAEAAAAAERARIAQDQQAADAARAEAQRLAQQALEQQRVADQLAAEQRRLAEEALAQSRAQEAARAEAARQQAERDRLAAAAAAAAEARAREEERARQAAEQAAQQPTAPLPPPAPPEPPPPVRPAPVPPAPPIPQPSPTEPGRPVSVPPAQQSEHERLTAAAILLRDYLIATPTVAAFGYKGHPSPRVAAFQRIAKITDDGILGDQTRAAGRTVNVTFPARPSGSAPPATRPVVQAPPAPATPPAVPPPTASAPAPSSAPPGYDPALARQLAPQVASSVRGKKYGYDRALTARFQTAAGITSDGIYGGGTRGALLYYGATQVPNPLFKPNATTQYVPPGGVVPNV